MKAWIKKACRSRAACAALALTCALPLQAHDFWIEPSHAWAKPGDTIDLTLRTGEHFVGEAYPRNPQMIKKFIGLQAGKLRAVTGEARVSPAGRITASDPGLLMIGYQSHWLGLTQEGTAFDKYLGQEGLDTILAERRAQATHDSDVSEVFMRCAKSLIRVVEPRGSAARDTSGAADTPLGFPLEIVPLSDPHEPNPTAMFSVRVLHEGRPLAGVLVMALNRANGMEKQAVRSNADGVAHFVLTTDGAWLIKAVHMVKAAPELRADWASYWASLTFETDSARVNSRTLASVVPNL
jgi:uncharacterized GH25 family protein